MQPKIVMCAKKFCLMYYYASFWKELLASSFSTTIIAGKNGETRIEVMFDVDSEVWMEELVRSIDYLDFLRENPDASD